MAFADELEAHTRVHTRVWARSGAPVAARTRGGRSAVTGTGTGAGSTGSTAGEERDDEIAVCDARGVVRREGGRDGGGHANSNNRCSAICSVARDICERRNRAANEQAREVGVDARLATVDVYARVKLVESVARRQGGFSAPLFLIRGLPCGSG